MVIWEQHRGVTLLLTSVISIFSISHWCLKFPYCFYIKSFFLHFLALLKKYFRIYEHLILKVIYAFFSKDAIYHEIAFPQNRHWFALIFSVGFLFYAVIIPSGCNICSVDKLLYSPVHLHHVLITRYIPIKPGSRHNYYSSVPCNFLSNQRWLSEVKYK